MKVHVYPRYQDSGVDWIGPIPAGWQTEPLKVAYSVVGGATPKSEVEDYWDGGVPWVTPGDLSKLTTPFIGETIRTISEEGLASCAAAKVPTGSVILSTRAPIGSLGITTEPATTNQGCKALVPRRGANPRFLAYTLSVATKALNVKGKGTTFLELSGDELARFKVPSPSAADQSAIAAFLDRETGKIDALVEAQRRLIELLKEKRQAVISHAVIKGLDPTAPMEDSGVEWLGELPVHWDVSRLKRLTPGITVGIVVEPSKYYVDEGVPALRSLNVKPGRIDCANMVFISDEANELLSKSKLQAGDLVSVRTGQPGTTAIIPPELDGANCIDLIVIRRPFGSERFLCWYLSSDAAVHQFSEGSGGAIQQHFNIGTAVNLLVPDAPIEEQKAIADFLDCETKKLDALVNEALRAMSLLQERRSSLIAAAVTGKIDVRGLAVRETEAA